MLGVFSIAAMFVTEWLVSGPYPNLMTCDNGTALDTDFLVGEADVSPTVGETRKVVLPFDWKRHVAKENSANEWGFREPRTFDAVWREKKAADGVKVVFDGDYAPVDDYFAVYAVTWLRAPSDCDVLLGVGSDDDHKVWVNGRLVGRHCGSQGVVPGQFRHRARLVAGLNRVTFKLVDRTNEAAFCLSVASPDGTQCEGVEATTSPSREELAALRRRFARTAAEVEAENARLVQEIAEAEKTLAALNRRHADAQSENVRRRAAHAAAFAEVERRFAEQRAAAVADAPRSCDRPVPAAPERRRLLLNGEWRASADKGRTWETLRLPEKFYGAFWRQGNAPVRLVDPKGKDGVWGAVVPLPGWEGYAFPKAVIASDVRAVKSVTIGRSVRSARLLVGGVIGFLDVFVNGKKCGDTYRGTLGRLSYDVTEALREGENEIELRWRNDPWTKDHQRGIVGDIELEYLPSRVFVDDLRISTSWRKAELAASVGVTNALPRSVCATVRPYAVADGRVRLALPPETVEIPSGSRTEVRCASKWADPKLWGIGGKYGDPDLYELVVDVEIDGMAADRLRETFGFREFWIHTADFYLNGRRIELRGDTGGIGPRKKEFETVLALERGQNFNAYRAEAGMEHDPGLAEACDRMGVLLYVGTYPRLTPKDVPAEAWPEREEHRYNVGNYVRFWKLWRNHPSVVIWSTDNEIWIAALSSGCNETRARATRSEL